MDSMSPKQQGRPLPSLLSVSSSMDLGVFFGFSYKVSFLSQLLLSIFARFYSWHFTCFLSYFYFGSFKKHIFSCFYLNFYICFPSTGISRCRWRWEQHSKVGKPFGIVDYGLVNHLELLIIGW